MSDAKLIIRDLIIRNYKGAKNVTIYGAGPGVIELTGANEAGKTSTRQAIPALLAGLKFTEQGLKLWDDALTHGATKGSLYAALQDLNETGECELDGLTIKRVFNRNNQAKGGSLVAKTKDGHKLKQGDLSALLGDCAFDPLEWGRKKTEDQIKSLDDLVDAETLAKLKRVALELTRAEEERRETNREIKTFGQIPDLPKVESVDTAELMRQLQEADAHNREHANRAAATRELQRDVERWDSEIRELEKRLESVRATRAQRQLKLEEYTTKHPISPATETGHIHEKLARAGDTNAKAEQWRTAEEQRAKLAKLTRKSTGYDQKIEDLREEKRQLHESAKVPIDGLEWDSDSIRWNGVVYSGLSESQRLRLTMLVEIARHPGLHVMCIPNIDLLDDQNFTWLMKLALEAPYQIFAESVRGARTDDAIEIVLGEYGESEPWEE